MMSTGKILRFKQYGLVEIEVLLSFLGLLMQSSLGLSDIEQPESKSVIPSNRQIRQPFHYKMFLPYVWAGSKRCAI
jgi:hypothetical protein